MQITFKDVSYIYNRKSPFEFAALNHINLDIPSGKFIAIVGKTGSGKSTLISHINALSKPSEGEVKIGDFINSPKKHHKNKEIKLLRKKAGLIFQFPEYQLFEETVEKDVMFGPKNFGKSKEESLVLAHEALNKVGLNETFYQRSPFELSGGEKRKVAIAGVIASEPETLIVDEPTAGLDPVGAIEIMDLFKKINEAGTTLILVTHDMNIVSQYADIVIVIEEGKVINVSTPSELFTKDLEEYSLELPILNRVINDFAKKGIKLDYTKIKNAKDLAKALKEKRYE